MTLRAFAALATALTISVTTQSANGETIQYHLVAPGGRAANGEFQTYGVTGQPAVGSALGAGTRHNAGYAYLVRDYFLGTLIPVGADVVIPALPTGLRQNYPNPFNPTTTIEYTLAASEQVSIRIYDVTGSLVRTLVDQRQPHGRHHIVWDGRTQRGAQAGSGIYFCRFVAGSTVQTRKMTLLK